MADVDTLVDFGEGTDPPANESSVSEEKNKAFDIFAQIDESEPPREGEPLDFDDLDPLASNSRVQANPKDAVDFFTTVEYQSPSEPFGPSDGLTNDLLGDLQEPTSTESYTRTTKGDHFDLLGMENGHVTTTTTETYEDADGIHTTSISETSEGGDRVDSPQVTCTPATPNDEEDEEEEDEEEQNSVQENPEHVQTSQSGSPPQSDQPSVVESTLDDLMGDFGEGIAPKAEQEDFDLSPKKEHHAAEAGADEDEEAEGIENELALEKERQYIEEKEQEERPEDDQDDLIEITNETSIPQVEAAAAAAAATQDEESDIEDTVEADKHRVRHEISSEDERRIEMSEDEEEPRTFIEKDISDAADTPPPGVMEHDDAIFTKHSEPQVSHGLSAVVVVQSANASVVKSDPDQEVEGNDDQALLKSTNEDNDSTAEENKTDRDNEENSDQVAESVAEPMDEGQDNNVADEAENKSVTVEEQLDAEQSQTEGSGRDAEADQETKDDAEEADGDEKGSHDAILIEKKGLDGEKDERDDIAGDEKMKDASEDEEPMKVADGAEDADVAADEKDPSESSDINEGGPSGGSPRIDSPVSPPSPAGSSQPETSTPLSQASPGGTSLPPLSPGSSTGGRLEDTLADFQPPKRYVKPEEKQTSRGPGVIIMKGASNDMVCKLCQKRVYEMEKIIADKAVYHKTCFKCTHCKRVLSLKNFASIEGELYCKPHFIEIFKTKGNYDEGFGRARAKAKESASETNLQSSSVQKVQAEEVNSTPQQQREILRADDKLEDGRDSIPNIKSLRSRFESSDGDSRKSDWRSSTNGDRAPALSSNARTPSRWDKPKGETPAPINRRPEEDSDGGEVHEEELPAPSHTKNMLAKFKAFEGDQTTPVKKTTSLPSRQARPSPDSGIYETDSYTNGHSRPDDDDSPRNRAGEVVTEELPESGFTRNLVAQWRNKEQESGLKTPSPTVATSKSPARSFSNRSVASSQRTMTPDRDVVVSASEVEDVDGSPGSREVVREADRDDESELPPPSFTRNMLAKFQSMQDEAQREATTVKPVSKKAGSGSQQFKWQVKESITLKGPTAPNDFNRRQESVAI